MGARFIEAGLLTEAQVTRVVELQASAGIRFGEAAVRLGLLTEQNVQAVLSEQFNYATALVPSEHLDKSLDIALMPFGLEAESIRQIRAELSIRLSEQDRISLAIVSSTEGEGKSYLAASLALAFSQMGKRTLLIDADMRKPTQHILFGLENKSGLSTMLAGRTAISGGTQAKGFPHLYILNAGPKPPNPLEILLQPALSNLIKQLADDFEVFIVDTPAAQTSSDAQTISQQVGMCLLVARQHHSRLDDLRQTQAQMKTAGAQIIGTVYNEFAEQDSLDQLEGKGKKLWYRLRKWLSNPLHR
jgi:chain length determinant protein tyrosine kinase EpsG